ncbi:MAG: hypothetical protein ACFE8O_05900 [Candidatus Hermodarchaeota archaeon]
MNRKTKAAIAVIVCIIPISVVFLGYTGLIVVYTHPFAVYCNWTCLDEQILQFEVNPPYIQWKLVVNVTEITGDHPHPDINRTITVYDSYGIYIWTYMEINTTGIHSTVWADTEIPSGFAPGAWNISIRGNGWYFGGFQGQITVYARTLAHILMYGS